MSKVQNAGMASVTPMHLQRMLSTTGLRWVMSRAQWSVISSHPGDVEVLALFRNFYGLPVEVSEFVSPHVIELRDAHNNLFSRMEALSVPVGFTND